MSKRSTIDTTREKAIRKNVIFSIAFKGLSIIISLLFDTPLHRQIQLWNLDDY